MCAFFNKGSFEESFLSGIFVHRIDLCGLEILEITCLLSSHVIAVGVNQISPEAFLLVSCGSDKPQLTPIFVVEFQMVEADPYLFIAMC